MTLSICLLGTFEVRRDGQPINDFRAQSVRALLAYLALEANRPHEREHICVLLWPDEPLHVALTNLRQVLHRLRHALEPEGKEGRYLLITRYSVRLNLTEVEVDAIRFVDVLALIAAHSHRSPESCEHCVGLMHDALGHYRGDLLPGFSLADSGLLEEWLLVERDRLVAAVCQLLENLSTYYERRGDLGSAVDLLRRWASLDPWSDRAQLRLLRALAINGQVSLALRQYERYRALLARELSIEPSTAVKELITLILTRRLVRPQVGVRHAPAATTPFVGRTKELAFITALLGDPSCRLITLTGHGGSGKTRLALEAGKASCHAFADGSVFVSLTTLSHGQMLPQALCDALDLVPISGQPLLERVVDHLHGRELLLVLDNCEQVQELGLLLSRLLVSVPRLTVLATSRFALNLHAEFIVPVEGLAVATADSSSDPVEYAAGQCFLHVARRVRPDYVPSEAEVGLVQECCILLDGMPLGIELAASQLRSYRLDEIVAGMRANLDSLTMTMGDVNVRHHSLRAVFDWSWQLLDPLEQHTLARLAVFSGGCDRAAALALCGSAGPLDQLVVKSLVRRDVSGRYLMHEQTRQFAEEHLALLGEVDNACAQHGSYYLRLAAAQAMHIDGPNAGASIAALRIEYGNLCRAWNWATQLPDYELLAEAIPVFRQLYARIDLAAGVMHFSEALSRIGVHTASAVAVRCQLLDGIISQLRAIGHSNQAWAYASELMELARAANDSTSEAAGMIHFGDLMMDKGNFVVAWDYLKAAEQLSASGSSRQERVFQAHALLKQASLIDTQQLPVEQCYAERAYALYSELDMPHYASLALNRLGNQHRRCGDYARSLEARRNAMALLEDQGDLDVSTGVLNDLGEIYLLFGRYEEAREVFAQALAMARRLNMRKSEIGILEGLGRSLFHIGELRSASAHLNEALTLDAKYGTHMHRGYYLTTQGYIAEREHRWQEAKQLYDDALCWWEASNHRSDAVTEPRAGLVRVALAQGDVQATQAHVEALRTFLTCAPLQDALEPMLVHLSCYQALATLGNERAEEILKQAYSLLEAQAGQISDPSLRDSFLNNVAAHHAIREAWRKSVTPLLIDTTQLYNRANNLMPR